MIADQTERTRALDPAESFIIQAPAGSGKTGLLVQRILKLLTIVDNPEEIVAITFTRKAAGEMRDRIMAALHNAGASAKPAEEYERITWQLARDVLDRDIEMGWNLLSSPARLKLQTIDSLCASLARQMPILSGFGAVPRITEDASALYQQAAMNTLSELESDSVWSDAIQHLIAHLDNRLDHVVRLICNMLARRDQWLRHVGDPAHPALNRGNLEDALARLIQVRLLEFAQHWPMGISSECLVLMDFANTYLEPEVACDLCFDEMPGFEVDDLASWKALAGWLLTNEGTVRRAINKRQGFPAKGSGKTAEEKAYFESMKQRMKALLSELGEVSEAVLLLDQMRSLPTPVYTDEEWETLQALFELLRLSAAHLDILFRERGEIDFAAMSQAALFALGRADTPTDLAQALDYRIRHLLVDEFQDTSWSQFELIRRLTEEWQPGDGHSLFLVGDPMQSIYRFREAEVGLFLEAWEKGIGFLPLKSLRLTVNFRSQAGIIDWVNQSFSHVMPEKSNMENGAVSYAPSIAWHDYLEREACHIYPAFDQDEQQEAEQILAIIQECRLQHPDNSIAILVRGRTHLALILSSLKSAGLAFKAVDIESLTARPVIQDLQCLLQALLHPADRIAWLGVLRAPWCGLDLNDLHVLCGHDNVRTLPELIQDDEICSQLSQSGLVRLTRAWKVLAATLKNLQKRSLRDWLEGCWFELGGPACLQKETDIEDADVFFRLLDDLDSVPLSQLQESLSRAVDKLYALPDMMADDSLQIMTMHKAKGLEFDTVILPGMGYKSANKDTELMKWLEHPRYPNGNDLLIAPIRKTGFDHNLKYQLISDFETKKEQYEMSRVLYVAATRAREQLHILGSVKSNSDGDSYYAPARGSLLAALWPVLETVYEQAFEVRKEEQEADTLQTLNEKEYESTDILYRLSDDWQCPEPPPALMLEQEPIVTQDVEMVLEFDWAGETARVTGIIVHECLQHMFLKKVRSFNADVAAYYKHRAIHTLRQEGMNHSEIPAAADRILTALENTLEDSRGRWILDSEHHDSRSEYPLSGLTGKGVRHYIIDRTFIDSEGIRWIIDYKTGHHAGGGLEKFLDHEQERYESQLQSYGHLMSVKEGRPVMLGLYFPLLQAWRAWPYKK